MKQLLLEDPLAIAEQGNQSYDMLWPIIPFNDNSWTLQYHDSPTYQRFATRILEQYGVITIFNHNISWSMVITIVQESFEYFMIKIYGHKWL